MQNEDQTTGGDRIKACRMEEKPTNEKPWIPTNPHCSTFFFRDPSSLAPLGTSGFYPFSSLNLPIPQNPRFPAPQVPANLLPLSHQADWNFSTSTWCFRVNFLLPFQEEPRVFSFKIPLFFVSLSEFQFPRTRGKYRIQEGEKIVKGVLRKF